MEPVLRDVRLALRRLRMAPGFTIFAVVSLALGLGVSTAIYSAVRTFFWMPLGVVEQEELVAITSQRIMNGASWPDFQDFRGSQVSFRTLGASRSIRLALAAAGAVEPVFGEAVSGDYFATMGVVPMFGRLLQPGDEAVGARVAVVSERFWRSRLHGDPRVVGQTIKLGGQPFEVIGVTRGTFHGLSRPDKSIWIPITASPQASDGFGPARELADRRVAGLFVWGRLRAGVTVPQARAEVALFGRRLGESYPTDRRFVRGWDVRPKAAEPADSETVNTIVGMILTAVAAVLLIACTNLANLALARGTSRTQETAVRSALGASRWRLIREQLIEGAIVTVAGGTLGAAVLAGLTDYLTADLPLGLNMTMPFTPIIDMTVLLASAGGMTVSLLVFALWPALQSTRADIRGTIGAGAGATPPKWRLHRNLVAWQVCGSVALLLVAAMSAKVIGLLGRPAEGGSYDHLALAQVDFALNGKNEAQSRRLSEAILSAVRARPGVESVSASNGLPFGFWSFRSSQYATTADTPFDGTRDIDTQAYVVAATPELFRTLSMRLTRGRAFTDRDDVTGPPVAIVSEHLARQLFRSTDVVGRALMVSRARRLSTGSPAPLAMAIVGVSADTDVDRVRGVIFRPFAQGYDPLIPVTISARASDPSAAAGVLRSAIRDVDPEIALDSAGTGAVLLGPFFLLVVIVRLSTGLGLLALVLAMAGLFGVLSHVVVRRTREIGIRIAIGADRAQIFRLILRDGLYPVIKGLTLGLGIGAAARLAVRAWVVTDANAFDPLVFSIVPVPFIIAAVIACYVPAARASRVDPNVALRDL